MSDLMIENPNLIQYQFPKQLEYNQLLPFMLIISSIPFRFLPLHDIILFHILASYEGDFLELTNH